MSNPNNPKLSCDLVVGDTWRPLQATLTVNGVALDLTGCTGIVNYKCNGATAQVRTMSIPYPLTGQILYYWLVNDLQPGPIEGEITVTNGSGQTLTDPLPFTGLVRARLT